MRDRQTVLFIGASDAGKSNYIFRLWISLRDGRHRALKISGLPDDLEYLKAGAHTQLGGNFAGHTPKGTSTVYELPIELGSSAATLILPDRPGEDWSRIYKDRRWPSEWSDLIDQGTSCLLFVRVNSPLNQSPLDWISVQRFYGSNDANLDMGPAQQPAEDERIRLGGTNPQQAEIVSYPTELLQEGAAPHPTETNTNSSDGPPTQVVLIDWIQMLATAFRKRASAQHKPRIGLVVSAWDALSEDDREGGPLEYLRREFRMLADFLDTNQDRFVFGVFGISLYGGDFDNQSTFRREFLQNGNPRDRGCVIYDDLNGTIKAQTDLTFPVMWALGEEKSG